MMANAPLERNEKVQSCPEVDGNDSKAVMDISLINRRSCESVGLVFEQELVSESAPGPNQLNMDILDV